MNAVSIDLSKRSVCILYGANDQSWKRSNKNGIYNWYLVKTKGDFYIILEEEKVYLLKCTIISKIINKILI